MNREKQNIMKKRVRSEPFSEEFLPNLKVMNIGKLSKI